MVNFNQKNKGFTLVETIIVCTLFAFMVLGIILGINKAYAFINNTRLLVRATNFAREGVEMVYNIRDTNWRRYSGIKDKHRNDTGTGNSKFFSTGGIYVLKENIGENGKSSTIYAEYLTGNSDDFYSIDGFFRETNEANRELSKITFTGNYSFYSGGSLATGSLEELLKGNGTEFYRILRVYGIYCKDSTNTDEQNCLNNDSEGKAPKEMRFCVKVFYDGIEGKHSTELCSIMTNFME